MSADKQLPAFPTPLHNIRNDGMTLRDYFAAMAMQGIFANENFPGDITQAPEIAYVFADLMLKAREA